MVCREVYKHLAHLEPEHRFGSRFAAATTMVQPPTNSYCQSASAGIYSVPSLAPLTNKVSQVEMEAGDCEGRSASAFFAWMVLGLWLLVFDLSRGMIDP